MTVHGSNLTGATAVRFGSATGTHLHVVGKSELTVRSPKHGKGRVDIRVTTKHGTSKVTKDDRFTYS